jgi:3D (Asp-Asp-Asp) domain-containing protein
MYIVSADGKYTYGYAIAADTGGFAKRNPYMVDLYFNTESACINFGIRNVKIYVLE